MMIRCTSCGSRKYDRLPVMRRTNCNLFINSIIYEIDPLICPKCGWDHACLFVTARRQAHYLPYSGL